MGPMGTLTIRNLGDRVIETLEARAKANRRSLEAEVRCILTQTVDRGIRIDHFRKRTLDTSHAAPSVPQTDSVALLREDRER